MNNTIKRLAEQAVAESNLPASFWWITQDPKMAKVAERFAQLIIEKCVEVVISADPSPKMILHEPYRGIVSDIEEFFGEEE